eukprot:CAMPEP_0206428354 /NCGR_PEP_ID=MMETSP0324_2-20121206/5608_1 /ASSEMBLY_ACC=CAM_ASM_000836 /TAXON_ID=2866 /ORGANISM="Crypthecodinium cohnii, Strain Seligo" /LENGTH=182 /DNA_ID=CAMNT_0053893853 /DNA_START=347 /DNA_END=896 /DNA_ORIENTATION=-
MFESYRSIRHIRPRREDSRTIVQGFHIPTAPLKNVCHGRDAGGVGAYNDVHAKFRASFKNMIQVYEISRVALGNGLWIDRPPTNLQEFEEESVAFKIRRPSLLVISSNSLLYLCGGISLGIFSSQTSPISSSKSTGRSNTFATTDAVSRHLRYGEQRINRKAAFACASSIFLTRAQRRSPAR